MVSPLLLISLLLLARTARALSFEESMSNEEWDSDAAEDESDIPALQGLSSCGPVPERSQAVVIGCGLAGLFAAARLKKEGVDVTIVEADEKCGGRLRSNVLSKLNFGQAEYGANFMYGKQKGNFRENPIWALFQGYGVSTEDYLDNKIAAYDPDANMEQYNQATVDGEQKTFLKRNDKCLVPSGEDWFIEGFQGLPPTPDQRAPQLLRQCTPNNWIPDTPLKEAMSHYYYELENGRQLNQIGRGAFGEDSFFDFTDDVFVQNDARGTSSVINDEWIGDHLDDVRIDYNTVVKKVRYANDKQAKVVAIQTGRNGIPCQKKYRADYVIATPSIDVLRKKINFRPSLNNRLDDHPIHINTMEKVWVQFSEPFWPQDEFLIVVTNMQEQGRGTVFFNLNKFYPGCNILQSYLSKDMVDYLESAYGPLNNGNRNAIQQHISDLLKLAPGVGWEFEMTDWRNDDKFLGSWEYWKFGLDYADYFAAIQPKMRLHLAGAAHCNRYYGFTWGAICSGAWMGEWVAGKINVGPNFQEPYSPCNDPNNIVNPEWREFYLGNPFFA